MSTHPQPSFPEDTRVFRTIGCSTPEQLRCTRWGDDGVRGSPAHRSKEACSQTGARPPRFPNHSFLRSRCLRDCIRELRAIPTGRAAIFLACFDSSTATVITPPHIIDTLNCCNHEY